MVTGAPSLSQRVYGQIKEAISSGALAPGSRVRENDLAEQLNVSRTPVREALKLLEASGLVTHAAHEGMVIAKLDHQSVIELYAMREVLEGTAARFAARHASEAEIQELEDLAAAEANHPGDSSRLARLNRSFHGALYRAGHNRYLVRTLLSLDDAMVLLGGTTLAVPHRSENAHNEHLDIVAAITRRDADAAEAATREHIRNAQRARLKLMRDKDLD